MSTKRTKTQPCQPKHHRAISWAAMVSLSQGLCWALFRRTSKGKRKTFLFLPCSLPFQIRPMNSGRTKSRTRHPSSPESSTGAAAQRLRRPTTGWASNAAFRGLRPPAKFAFFHLSTQ
ncbi:hypothetical protein LZ32DRAFT_39829 [Colletotrichum eremochloae]|nr:hypothetical protein LZ32DRAFT_39829 [Colletotrichum eremochloae]